HALPGDGLDQTLLLATVPDGAPSCIDPGGQGRVGNDPPVPDGGNQVVLADDSLAISDQIIQEVEDPRRNANELGSATQLAPVRVQHIIFALEPQFDRSPRRTTVRRAT